MTGTVLPRVARPPTFAELTRADVESVRLMLKGDSVIDWHRLAFTDHAEVDRFLRLNEFDPESDDEMGRLEDIRADAVDYLARAFSMSIPEEVAGELPARDLFMVASRHGPHQKWACVVLKVMHIIHHIGGRAGLLKLSVSDEIVFREIELKVMRVVEQLRAAGAPIAEFEWSRKPRDSQITKLLAKRSTIAASIYDKLRFRLIVPTAEDLVPTLATLTRQLVPFNYVVPGESVNQLVDLAAVQARARARRESGRRGRAGRPAAVQRVLRPRISDRQLRRRPAAARRSPAATRRRATRSLARRVRAHRVPDRGQGHRAAQRVRCVEPRGLQGAPARARPHAPVPRRERPATAGLS